MTLNTEWLAEDTHSFDASSVQSVVVFYLLVAEEPIGPC